MQRGTVLIVDEEGPIRSALEESLEKGGYKVAAVCDGRRAIDALEEGSYDVVLLDGNLPGASCGELLREIRSRDPGLPVIVTTRREGGPSAAAAVKEGASDHVAQPSSNEDIECRVRKVLETERLRKELHHLRRQEAQRFGLDRITGNSPSLQAVFQRVSQILPSGEGFLLIEGEPGTGKEALAKAIHHAGPRATGAYASVRPAASSETLLESEVFGRMNGASAREKQKDRGLLDLTSGGTIFFDEIACMSLRLQQRILQLLEQQTFRRAGGSGNIHANVTVIAATSKDLKSLVEKGQFREDLCSRLQAAAVRLPPLRERPEDIPHLVEQFIGEYNLELNKDVKGTTPTLAKLLQEYPWPGNVRELKNAVERAMILATGEFIGVEEAAAELREGTRGNGSSGKPSDGSTLQLTRDGVNLEMLEKDLVCQALHLTRGNQTRAGKLLGLNRDQIRYRIEKFNLRVKDRAPSD